MKTHYVLFLILLVFLTAIPLSAIDIKHETSTGVDFAYYFDHNYGGRGDGGFVPPSYKPLKKPEDYSVPGNSLDKGRDLGTGWGAVEIQAFLEHSMTTPIFRGNSSLTKDNNLKVVFRGNIAPVLAYAQARAIMTPVAFMNFEAGVSVGSGWTGMGFTGIGLNNDGSGEFSTDPFPGAVIESWFAGTFQFDLAALVPGEWNHVVAVANAKIRHHCFTAAEEKEPWSWKVDRGENFNGLLFEGTYVLGYQMPLKVDMIGLLAETSQYIDEVKDYSPMDDKGFGSDFIKVTFGPLARIGLNEHNSLTVLMQFQTDKRYDSDTIHNNWFVNRQYDSTFVRFHRLALAYKYKF